MKKSVILVRGFALALAAAVVGEFGGASVAFAAQDDAPDATAVAALAAAIEGALDKLPADASQTDAAAAITFALDQSSAPQSVKVAALNAINKTRLSKAQVAALDAKIKDAGAKSSGTGGTGGTGGALTGATAGVAAGPSIGGGGGGGSSDYTGRPTT